MFGGIVPSDNSLIPWGIAGYLMQLNLTTLQFQQISAVSQTGTLPSTQAYSGLAYIDSDTLLMWSGFGYNNNLTGLYTYSISTGVWNLRNCANVRGINIPHVFESCVSNSYGVWCVGSFCQDSNGCYRKNILFYHVIN